MRAVRSGGHANVEDELCLFALEAVAAARAAKHDGRLDEGRHEERSVARLVHGIGSSTWKQTKLRRRGTPEKARRTPLGQRHPRRP